MADDKEEKSQAGVFGHDFSAVSVSDLASHSTALHLNVCIFLFTKVKHRALHTAPGLVSLS